MDRVDSVAKLQGWRAADAEELVVIKGLMLQEAKKEAKSEFIMNMFLVMFSYVCFVGVWNVFQYIETAFTENDISNVIVLGAILVVLVLIGMALGATFVKNLRMKTAKIYQKAIKNNSIRVNDVVIYEVFFFRDSIGNAALAPRVKVKDAHSTYCEENIVFECCNGYKETTALLIEVILSKNKNETVSRKCVIPCKEFDPKLWNLGMKYYNKIMK